MADEANDEDGTSYGTSDRTGPVSRADFERAIRGINLGQIDLRDMVIQLAARVIALTDEVTRRIDRVEPQPAPPGTPAAEPTQTVEDAVVEQLDTTLAKIRMSEAQRSPKVALDLVDVDKYTVPSNGPNCSELLHLCKARCCQLTFCLSTQDLDEGVIRFDYGQPYLIRQRASDTFCVHNDPATHYCTVHTHRPRVCRSYDCRDDKRIWTDFEAKLVAPPIEPDGPTDTTKLDLVARVRQRAVAVAKEQRAINTSFADIAPSVGPKPR